MFSNEDRMRNLRYLLIYSVTLILSTHLITLISYLVPNPTPFLAANGLGIIILRFGFRLKSFYKKTSF